MNAQSQRNKQDYPVPAISEPLQFRKPPSHGYLSPSQHEYSRQAIFGLNRVVHTDWLTAQYVQPHATEFVFPEASLSQRVRRFRIKHGAGGKVAFIAKRESWRLSTLLCNQEDVVLYRWFERGFTEKGRRRLRDAYGYSIAALRGNGFSFTNWGLSDFCCNGKEEDRPQYEAHGDLVGKNYVIREVTSGTVVAEVKKVEKHIGAGSNKICVRVEAGRNAAFLIFFIITFHTE